MSADNTFRKPYVPKVEASWWLKNPFFTRYIIREGTSLVSLFVCLELLLGVFCFALSDAHGDVYLAYVNGFLGNIVIILLNLVALASCLFHAVTWFALMPKAVRLFMNKNSTELLPGYVPHIGLYLALVGATLVILVAAFVTM
ncbi:MAG: fumarate reductase subunit C [Succinivibrionaceae bacterium]|nr:fumarate reductase subunit C [Succinivibrionaceae bacterium]